MSTDPSDINIGPVLSIFEALPTGMIDHMTKYGGLHGFDVARGVSDDPGLKHDFRVELQTDYIRDVRAQINQLLFDRDGLFMVRIANDMVASSQSLRIAADYLDELNRGWSDRMDQMFDEQSELLADTNVLDV